MTTSTFGLAHKLRVMALYRHSLKTCLAWAGERVQWYPRARAIREEFESNREAQTREEAAVLCDKADKLLKEYQHPDPIIRPYYPGGTSYSRNPPMPPIKIWMDFGREPWVIPKHAQAHTLLTADHAHEHEHH